MARRGVIRARDLGIDRSHAPTEERVSTPAGDPPGVTPARGTARRAAAPQADLRPPPWLGADGRPLTLDELNRLHIGGVLRLVEGNVSETARQLGLPRTTLRHRMEALGLDAELG